MAFTATDHRAAAEIIASMIDRFDPVELGAWLERSNYAPRFNIGPSQAHWLVRARSGRPILTSARWGMLGPNRKLVINARAETLTQRPMFRGPFARARGLVVADGFFEWDRRTARPQPWWFRPTARRGLLFAAVVAREGDELDHFSIVTVPANADVGELHPRMPAIIDPADHARWLFGSEADAARLLVSAPAGSLCASPVSRRVNSLEHDDPACLEPVELGRAPPPSSR